MLLSGLPRMHSMDSQVLKKRVGVRLGSGWCQTIPLSLISDTFICKTASSRYGTTYEQVQEHRPSLSSHQLYSLGTVFGQQGAEPKRGRSVKCGDLYRHALGFHRTERCSGWSWGSALLWASRRSCGLPTWPGSPEKRRQR